VRPFAVDVNSGVDDENGEKDPEKIHHFTQNSRDLNS
jgi:phosphoribosylanthranilate isomerase